jgi:hypothetical protein
MNQNHLPSTHPAPRPHNKVLLLGSTIAAVTLLLIVVFLWNGLSRMKTDMQILTEENTQRQKLLEEQSSQLQNQLVTARTELAHFKTGDPRSSAKKENTQVLEKPKPVEYPETLILQTPEISQTADGLSARIQFQSTLTKAPGLLALVVRIPNGSNAVIKGFKPIDEAAYTDVKFRINESGKFAIFQGNPTHLDALVFELTVSEPVTATVRGTEGIKPFEIDIDPNNPSVRKL